MASISSMFRIFPTIELGRFLLRQIREDDADDLFAIYHDDETLQFEGMIPLTTREEMAQLIGDVQHHYNEHKAIRWIIEDQDTHTAIGSIAMYYIKPWQRSVCMGYVLHRDYWNQGIMYTCMDGLLRYLYKQYRVTHVLLTIWPQNVASKGLALKLGFIYQGVLVGSGYDARTRSAVDMQAFCMNLKLMTKLKK